MIEEPLQLKRTIRTIDAGHLIRRLTPTPPTPPSASTSSRAHAPVHMLLTLVLSILSRGFAWFDVGTPEALNVAGQFVEMIETRQNTRIACPEEVAFRMNYIDSVQLARLAEPIKASRYGQYILSLIEDRPPPGKE